MGAGARHKPVVVDQLLATLVSIWHVVTHDALASWFGVDRSTITRGAGEIRPFLADRGCRIEGGLRLRTLADVIAHRGTTGQTALMDASDIRVRRPSARRGGHSRFISGKSCINAMEARVFTDERGRLLFCGEVRAGSVADITRVRDADLADLLAASGYQGLAAQIYGFSWLSSRISPPPDPQAVEAAQRADTRLRTKRRAPKSRPCSLSRRAMTGLTGRRRPRRRHS
ncbi:helix-turn-helix domain-containing protein [Streptomyces zhihengii]|uniref:Transposase family protein n=1 Tax=Streptomyces zhihengii TaxID=1818004 RepID=A0ABS2V4X1_9ACTN|nr:transposase family protein [Streptomyces zhihengii]MBM9624534.1 transposase family protein [Streptomyces zhihengii]